MKDSKHELTELNHEKIRNGSRSSIRNPSNKARRKAKPPNSQSFVGHHPSFKECYGRAFMSGLVVFGLAFSGSYLTQQFLVKTYSRTIRFLLPTTVAASLSYYEAKRRLQQCYSSFQVYQSPRKRSNE